MKNTQVALAILAFTAVTAVTAVTVGCKPSAESYGTDARDNQAPSIAKTETAINEAGQELKDYTYAQKAEFVAKMESELADINRDLDALSAKIVNASDSAKAEAQPKLQALRDQTVKLTKHLDDAKSTTESTWDDVKANFWKGYAELKVQFQQARQWVSDKIAP